MVQKKSIEETYQKLSQREHVLHRPGMYIGDTKKHVEEVWCFEDNKMQKKVLEFSHGFMKIFDEILSNATDHATRDSNVTNIKVDYSKETGEISVWNNGSGVPVQIHKTENIYVPELIFGHLLSGSNYNDSETRTAIGVNGLGSKLTNLFSKKFIVETIDSDTKLKFIQEFTDNMENKSKPKVTKNTSKSYTKITFLPDYQRFGMNGLEDDTIKLICKRVYDCIAVTSNTVSIHLNGEKLKGKGLIDYTKYFFEESKIIHEVFEKGNYIWEYAIVPSESYEHVSFVNGSSTAQGGKHVDYIMYQIVNKLKTLLETKKKLKDVKPNFIKDRMFLFLRATVANPTFSSQAKEMLTTQSKDFGVSLQVSDKFIEKIYKSPIVDEIVEFCKLKETSDIAKKTDGSKKNKVYIPKLDDALWAGTSKSNKCTLILTEGDSAKTFAVWGKSNLKNGNEMYGTFPLRGKVLNIRDATTTQLANNEELNNLKQILGLKQGKVYKDTSELRYSKVMILTDADVDGSHIKALLINMFHAHYPSLAKMNFIQTFRTPIVKATKGKQVLEFYNEQDYKKWVDSGINLKAYNIKYFKGLGTSKKEDAKDAFNRLEELKLDYYYKDSKCDDSILLAFDKDKNTKIAKGADTVKCSDKRKEWLSKYDKESYVDMKETRVSYQDLINKELIHFSIYDNMRSIPNLFDGLKPSQRKILHYMLKSCNSTNKVIKVAQLSGYVSAETGYHHGEASLQGAIVGMAQNFVGSNNINLLYPDGNFGSRFAAGKDAASPRYIFTRLTDQTQRIFNPLDLPLLTYLEDDGMTIEPEFFMPVLPMILVNGCEGIGTGYSTFIPSYNPKDIIANLNRIVSGKDPIDMIPYYKGYTGSVEKIDTNTYITKGRYKVLNKTQVQITEIPIGMSVNGYKEFLESNINDSKKKDSKRVSKFTLKDVENRTKDENTGIDFLIEFKYPEELNNLIKNGTFEKELKLVKSIGTGNMHLFDEKRVLKKYNNTGEILKEFAKLRLDFYQRRKDFLVNKLSEELIVLRSKARFINEYINGTIDINRKSKDYIVKLLADNKYPQIKNDNDEVNYDYLIKMQLVSLTSEKIEELNKLCSNKEKELTLIKSKSKETMWSDDFSKINL